MRRRRAGVAVAVAAAIAATLSFDGVARADAVFSLSSSTAGVSVVAFNESFPLVQSVQTNAPSATASLNSRGQATAYSATPDPGHDASELPAVLAGVACTSAPIPGCSTISPQIPRYPVAYAQNGDQPQDVTLGAGHLHADASSTSSTGEASFGAQGAADATSTAHTRANADGTLDATAASDVDGLGLATYLNLSGVRATASLHRNADGAITTDSSFAVSTINVNGQTFSLTDGQFNVLGNLVPVPVPVQTVLDAFKAIGVTATYLPADKTANGITSAGLVLSYQVAAPPTGIIPPLPPLPIPIGIGLPSGPTTVSYYLGRVSTTGTYKSIPDLGTGVTGGQLTGGTVIPSTGPTAPTGGGVTTPPDLGSGTTAPVLGGGTLPSGTTSGALPLGGVGNPVVASPQTTGGGGVVTTAAGKPLTTDSVDIYLALVVAAFAAFGGATAIRILGVRRAWIS